MFDQYDQCLAAMNRDYAAGVGQRDLLQSQLAEKQAQLAEAKQDIVTWEQTQILLGKVSDFARVQTVGHIENIVTAALLAVFGERYQFKINLKTIGNQTAAEWQVISQYAGPDGNVEVAADPESAHGGGLVDVISIGLRLAMIELLRPKVNGPILLDEPGKHVSAEHIGNLAYFLQQYARKTERQVILITHQTALADIADVSYLVTQTDGISEVQKRG